MGGEFVKGFLGRSITNKSLLRHCWWFFVVSPSRPVSLPVRLFNQLDSNRTLIIRPVIGHALREIIVGTCVFNGEHYIVAPWSNYVFHIRFSNPQWLFNTNFGS
jgi:hypothetical protein